MLEKLKEQHKAVRAAVVTLFILLILLTPAIIALIIMAIVTYPWLGLIAIFILYGICYRVIEE
jgi:hypothetical protein